MHSSIQVFTISPRTREVNRYWTDICKVGALTEKYGLTGVLLFTGNDTHLEPWVVAQELLRQTTSISPLIAVNPIYMHPFAVAKMTASLTRLHGRKICLNMIIGTALSHQTAMGDHLSHDERYDRLGEYIEILKRLFHSRKPIHFSGIHYKVDGLQLSYSVSDEMVPEFFLAGQSDSARRICVTTGSTGIQMLPARLEDGLSNVSGIHFGILTRETEPAAWEAANTLFRENGEDREILEYSMLNTDAVWKRRMKAESDHAAGAGKGYWLVPFANFQADCPYLVGGYEYVAERLQRLVQKGITTFIFDIPANEEEFLHVSRVLQLSGIISSN